MEKIIIKGRERLHGSIAVSGAKNAALPIMTASLLTREKTLIHNIPDLRDVRTISDLLRIFGARVEDRGNGTFEIDGSSVHHHEAPYELVKTMRASCMVLGPLLARLGRAKVSLPGGCAIGERPINLHLKGLETLGAKIKLEHGYVIAEADRLKGGRIYFDIPTVTGTMNIMMAAVLAEGDTLLENAAKEPEIADLADMLRKMGAKIEGDGADTISITGVTSLHGVEHTIIPDRIETGTFIIAAAITGGEVKITNCIPDHSESLIMKLRESGLEIKPGKTTILIKGNGKIEGVDVETSPYPGFPTDMQAQIMSLLCIAKGTSIITETVFENRFMHVSELRRMGADIRIRGQSATVRGVGGLSGAPLMATDLRASASLLLAALAAEGESVISRVYHIDRGYERIEEKLSKLGANIRRVR